MWFLVVKGFTFIPFTLAFYSLSTEAPFYLFYACWFMSSVGSTTWYGPVFATVQDLMPARIRSTGVAFLLLALRATLADGGWMLASGCLAAAGPHCSLSRPRAAKAGRPSTPVTRLTSRTSRPSFSAST